MTERYCSPPCKRCTAPGPMLCAASARAEAEERHEEEVDTCHDAFRARLWERSNPAPPEGFDHPPTFLDRYGDERWSDPAYKYGRPPGT